MHGRRFRNGLAAYDSAAYTCWALLMNRASVEKSLRGREVSTLHSVLTGDGLLGKAKPAVQ